uniref:Neurensin 1 n=1 Tax=Neogobius melanostomus TaxID=47308 RepID=A0A8C6US32_9GOBI
MTSCTEMCGSGNTDPAQGTGQYQQYGVRSYLHQFYEECTASIWERDEDFQIQRSPSRWSSLLWKVNIDITLLKFSFFNAVDTLSLCLPQVCLVFGSLVLFAGLIVVLVGYTTPARIEAFGPPIMRAPTPGEGKVPVTLSKVQNIQPSNAKSET